MRKKRLVTPYKSSRSETAGWQKKSKEIPPQKSYFLGYSIISRAYISNMQVAVITIFLLLLTTVLLNKIVNGMPAVETRTVLAQSRDINHERNYWTALLTTSPDYLPGILELAKIEFELGQEDRARQLLQRASAINPNDERVKEVVELITL